MSQCVIELEQQKSKKADKQIYETEFFFIDYQMMIIEEKIRCIREDMEIPRFDDVYFSEMIYKKTEDEINDLVAVTADEDEQGTIRMQSAVIKQSAANFAPPPPKIVKRMVCGVILAAEPGPSDWINADTSNGSIAG